MNKLYCNILNAQIPARFLRLTQPYDRTTVWENFYSSILFLSSWFSCGKTKLDMSDNFSPETWCRRCDVTVASSSTHKSVSPNRCPQIPDFLLFPKQMLLPKTFQCEQLKWNKELKAKWQSYVLRCVVLFVYCFLFLCFLLFSSAQGRLVSCKYQSGRR